MSSISNQTAYISTESLLHQQNEHNTSCTEEGINSLISLSAWLPFNTLKQVHHFKEPKGKILNRWVNTGLNIFQNFTQPFFQN